MQSNLFVQIVQTSIWAIWYVSLKKNTVNMILTLLSWFWLPQRTVTHMRSQSEFTIDNVDYGEGLIASISEQQLKRELREFRLPCGNLELLAISGDAISHGPRFSSWQWWIFRDFPSSRHVNGAEHIDSRSISVGYKGKGRYCFIRRAKLGT